MDVKGKVVWVTGGTSGLGKATAEVFYEEGAKVVISGRNVEAGEAIAGSFGENGLFVKADSVVTAELEAAIAKIIETWGKIDILVNAAGISGIAALLTEAGPGPIDSFRDVIDINLVASYDVSRLVAWEMTKNEPDENGERGVIILISSVAADKIATGKSQAYAASKAGILGMVKEGSVELAPHGIRIVGVQPGIFTTPLIDKPGYEPIRELFVSRQTFPKREGDPRLIGELCLHIAKNWFLNRTCISCDAGYIG
jgi:NAD(P)-dependent dehydrogenase (short-subunit alcohol dehydrogenase family)